MVDAVIRIFVSGLYLRCVRARCPTSEVLVIIRPFGEERSRRTAARTEAKKAGRLRSEGKTYRVKDGDVLEILFSR